MSKRNLALLTLFIGAVFLLIGNFQAGGKPEIAASDDRHSDATNANEASREASIILSLEAVRRVQLGDFAHAAAICGRSAFLDSSEGDCYGYVLESFDKKIAGFRSAAISQEASGFPSEASLIARSVERAGKMEAPE